MFENNGIKNIIMGNIDITILKEIPNLTEKYDLIIEPLAPLSMVEDFPGSFYKALKSPSKKMICGLFENILGWHLGWQDRKQIMDDIKKIRKKQKVKFESMQNGSTYIPLLMEYFEIEDKSIEHFKGVVFYKDLWHRLHSRPDAVNHAKGTENIDYAIIPLKRQLKRDSKNNKKVDNKDLELFFKAHLSQYPLFYSTPTYREYININGEYHYSLLLDRNLAVLLIKQLQKFNVGFLGNSEGWINIKFKKNE